MRVASDVDGPGKCENGGAGLAARTSNSNSREESGSASHQARLNRSTLVEDGHGWPVRGDRVDRTSRPRECPIRGYAGWGQHALGRTASSLIVRLSRNVVLVNPLTSAGKPSAVSVVGPGNEFAGFALTALTGGASKFAIIGGRLPQRLGVREFILPLAGPNPNAESYAISAGLYKLYLLPAKGRTTVTLRLPGLKGATRLPSGSPVVATLSDPAPSINTTTLATTRTAGVATRSAKPTLFFFATYARYNVHVLTQFHLCNYVERPDGPNPYLPGCPSLHEKEYTPFTFSDERVDGDAKYLVYGGLPNRPAGHYGDGVTITSPTAAASAEYFSISVEL